MMFDSLSEDKEVEEMKKIVPFAAVNAVILNGDQKVLMTRRSAQIREPGMWCLPGGHVDGGEKWSCAMKREVKEEVGLEVLGFELLGIYSDPSVCVTAHKLPQKDYYGQFLVASFLVTEFAGQVQPNFEVDKWGWFSPEQLPTPCLRSHPIRVQDAYAYQGKVFVR